MTSTSPVSVTRNLALVVKESITEIKQLGEGTFGAVSLVSYRGKKYALKKLKANHEEAKQTAEEFIKEAALIAKLDNFFVVHIYGQLLEPPGLLLEYMNMGDLGSLILSKKQDRKVELTMKVKKEILEDVANGILFLHENGVAHQDIKPANVLMCTNKHESRVYAKISDFGTAKMVQSNIARATTQGASPAAFSLFYAAPEIFSRKGNKNPFKMDIYSFGVLACELLTEKEPYAGEYFENVGQFAVELSQGSRPLIPEDVSTDWRRLIEKCWNGSTEKRPTMKEVLEMVKKLQTSEISQLEPELHTTTTTEDMSIHKVTLILNKLTRESYTQVLGQLIELATSCAGLRQVVHAVHEMAICTPTLRDLCAELCYDLAEIYWHMDHGGEFSKIFNVKQFLLDRCQDVFEQEADGEGAEELHKRKLGNIRLLCQLFEKKWFPEKMMFEVIKALMLDNEVPSPTDLEAVTTLLTISGNALDHEKAARHMNAYFAKLKKLSTNETIPNRIRQLIINLLELRKNAWRSNT